MRRIGACAMPGCRNLAVDDAPLCGRHLQRMDADQAEYLAATWCVFELSQRSDDAHEYTRCLREVIRELRLTSGTPSPVQLRLVK